MANVYAITDAGGRLLGFVRADLIQTESGTIQSKPLPRAGLEYHELDVPDQLIEGPVEELHKELQLRLSS
jgi:hypothetical protein